MKKFFSIATASALVMLSGLGYGQERHVCGNEIIQEEVINNDPHLKARMDDYFKNLAAENSILEQQNARAQSKTTAEYENILIPVVFHVILNPSQFAALEDTAGLIDRINSQLMVINEDFKAGNSDISGVPNEFKSLIGKANITFALAKRDAQGKARLGIVYKLKNSSFSGFATQDNSVKRDLQGGSTGWDHTKYLNIWITNIEPPQSGGQVLGYGYNADYAQNVHQEASLAGIVIHYLALGRRTSTKQRFFSANTEKGRTLTHELGHYFNIWHIWGSTAASTSTDCNDDDGIGDTPVQAGANVNCPAVKKLNCAQKPHPGGEMYMNFMDYSTDACTKMFTQGQVDRMRASIGSVAQNPHLAFWPADVSPVEYNNKVEVGPNPSTGVFNIHFHEKYDQLKTITVTNTIGQLVKEITAVDQQTVNYNVDISTLAKGVYIVQLHFNEGVISRKVVVQ